MASLFVGVGGVSCGSGGVSDLDPYFPPEAGEPVPQVVVLIEETDNPAYDLVPVEVNRTGVSDSFDRKTNLDNDEQPLKVPPGRIRFVLENTGLVTHNFQVRGDSVKVTTKDVAPRRFGVLEVSLQQGAYVLVCTLSDHERRGMKRPLLVDPQVEYPAVQFTIVTRGSASSEGAAR
ncbi:MAG: hypothetical protein HYY31_05770 [Chloroflexi bacterium]|nr:hypothetical protein [Chloroflexota bacterium]